VCPNQAKGISVNGIVKRLIIEPGPKAKQPTVTIRIEAA
jgi:hypothetical protein